MAWFKPGITQDTHGDTLRKCSDIMNELSFYWKQDSLANNGFRLYACRMFLSCKLDKIDRSILLAKLGHPNKIQETNHGFQYQYYYFDIRQMPKDFDAPSTCSFISFNFGLNEKYISKIDVGDYDIW